VERVRRGARPRLSRTGRTGDPLRGPRRDTARRRGRGAGRHPRSFEHTHEFTRDERDFLTSVAHEAAQALARGRQYEREREARREAEVTREQLDFLARASELLARSLDSTSTLREVAELAVPRIADWCAIDVVGDGDIDNVAVTHTDPSKVELAHELRRRYPPDPNASTGLPHVLRSGESELYPDVTDEMHAASAHDPEHLELIRQIAMRAAMIVPLTARGRTLGALTFVSSDGERTYDEADLRFAEDLARRAALSLDNARHYRHERDVAVALQESLLPESVPTIPGVEFAAKYLSGTVGVDVGGDWYDVVVLDEQRVRRGDGGRRGTRRERRLRDGPAADGDPRLRARGPSAGRDRRAGDEFARTLPDDAFATLVYLSFDRRTGVLSLVNAGHPPALLRRASGETTLLSSRPGQPVGCLPGGRYHDARETLEPGSTLVLYTDGLIERRGGELDAALARLTEAVATGPGEPGSLAEDVTGAMLSDRERPDDVAVLVMRVAG
jgi:GAF domain-containing protein